MTRILAVGAHPDDVEFMCAGTLILLGRSGASLEVATLTPGDCGSLELSREAISALRQQEASDACRRLGARYHCLGFDDFGILYDSPSIRRLTALIRAADPAIVFTHPPADYLIDHENTSRLVRTACFAAPVPNYAAPGEPPAPVAGAIPALVYWAPVEGVDLFGQPVPAQFYVDISDAIEEKAELLACHRSQRDWLRAHHGVDEYLDSMRRWSAEAGEQASLLAGRRIRWAEAFRLHRGHAYPRPRKLEEMLDGRLIESR